MTLASREDGCPRRTVAERHPLLVAPWPLAALSPLSESSRRCHATAFGGFARSICLRSRGECIAEHARKNKCGRRGHGPALVAQFVDALASTVKETELIWTELFFFWWSNIEFDEKKPICL